ncbi:MAG: hypothetical protein OXN25_17090 [Candidatus Poribacteria bacterium]|nr:hypothetical protein [Candidatus Poribacteria bacterium]
MIRWKGGGMESRDVEAEAIQTTYHPIFHYCPRLCRVCPKVFRIWTYKVDYIGWVKY